MVENKNEILIADTHPLSREGLAALFARNLRHSVLHEAYDFPAVLARIAAHSAIGLVTIDLGLPGLRKGEGLRDLRVRYPSVRVVVVANTRDRDLILEVLSAGVHGYIPKDLPVDEMLNALQMVLSGRMYVPDLLSDLSVRNDYDPGDTALAHEPTLTDRQAEVLRLLAAGRSNKEIARLLRIAEGTVKVHITASFRMLGVHKRVGAAAAMNAKISGNRFAGSVEPADFGPQYAKPAAIAAARLGAAELVAVGEREPPLSVG